MSVWNSGLTRLVRVTVGDRTVVAFVANDKVVTVGSIEGVDDLTAVGKMTSLTSGAAIYDTNGNVIGPCRSVIPIGLPKQRAIESLHPPPGFRRGICCSRN